MLHKRLLLLFWLLVNYYFISVARIVQAVHAYSIVIPTMPLLLLTHSLMYLLTYLLLL